MDIPERYVWLCLQVGRQFDGFIDAFIGPPEWKRSVAAEEPVDPRVLNNEAQLLLDALDQSDLEDDRRRWLRGQLVGLECVTARMSGEEITWTDEVERTLGIRPTRTDTKAFEEIHRRLDAALPGTGSLRQRCIAWDEGNAVPREKLVPALERLRDVLGPRAHELAPMPSDESVTYELVSDKAWIAYAQYEGNHHTHVQINADLPLSIDSLVGLAAHESYPGHHTESTAKDAGLYRALGRLETSIPITASPEVVVSEGIGTLALEAALGDEAFRVVADVLADLDVRFDPTEAHEFHHAWTALYAVGTNAAFMLHEDGAATEEVEDYLREWGLESNEKAARTVAFLTDPSSRAYISAYPDGWRLCRAFAERAPGNFTRLLTEQLTVADLLA